MKNPQSQELIPLQNLIPEDSTLKFIQRILEGSPGIFANTGKRGTGTLTLLLAIVQDFSGSSLPVKFFTEDPNFPFQLPENWSIQLVKPDETAWKNAIEESSHESPSLLVADLLTINNYFAILCRSQQNNWFFTRIETPYIGIDVAYNIRDWGSLSYTEMLQKFSCIWSQTLIRNICQECARPVQVSAEDMKFLDPGSQKSEKLYQEVGCEACSNKGTTGRCGTYEILKIDDETRPILQAYLEENTAYLLPSEKHLTIQDYARELLREGKIGIQSYKQTISQNPLLRSQHLLEQEKYRSTQIQDMFSRFVTRQVVERILHQSDFTKIIEGERRKATCMFCDIRNFTSYAENNSPDEIFARLNDYFRDIIEIVFDYEGTIDKFIGDSIMLVFGAPTEQEDQELRAVRCAIDIQKKVADINQGTVDKTPINIGIGINTGEVIAGCLGSDRRMDYTVLGDVVNIAARLESKASAGQILISHDTFQAVRDYISCQSIGNLSLKGKSQLLEAFEVLYS